MTTCSVVPVGWIIESIGWNVDLIAAVAVGFVLMLYIDAELSDVMDMRSHIL
jgi:hypothetical protein